MKTLLLIALFSVFSITWVDESHADEYEESVKEVHQNRLQHYDNIVNVFKKFGINPEAVNDTLLDTNSKKVRDQLKLLSGQMKDMEKKLGGKAKYDNDYNNMKSHIRDLRASVYKSERLAEEQEDMPAWKKSIIKKVMPISRKVANTMMQPSVLESLMKLYNPAKMKKLAFFNFAFLIFLFIYKVFIKKPEPRLLKRLRDAIVISIVFTIVSTAVLPSLVFGKPYFDFLKAVKVSATKQFNRV